VRPRSRNRSCPAAVDRAGEDSRSLSSPSTSPVNPNDARWSAAGSRGSRPTAELADAGYHVYLVERDPSIGGHMAQFDKTFPTLDCSACILTPKMSEVGQHENVDHADVLRTRGGQRDRSGTFHVKVRKRARYVEEDQVHGLRPVPPRSARAKVVDNDYEAGVGYRKAIYTPFPQAVPQDPRASTRRAASTSTRGKCRACEKLCPTDADQLRSAGRDASSSNVGNILHRHRLQALRLPPAFRSTATDGWPTSSPASSSNASATPSGPTGGKIVLRDGKSPSPSRIAIVHCVGQPGQELSTESLLERCAA
jgi:heterodisulfide reductase subunit A